MHKTFYVTALACGVLLVATVSSAQPRPQGELALSAERLFGYNHSSTSYDDADTEVTISEFSLLGGRGSASNFNFPRAGVDYFVTDGLSIGGSLVFVQVSTTLDSGGDESDSDASALGLAPRIGYATMFSDHFGIWPRGGLMYFSSERDDIDISGWVFEAEFPLLLAPSNSVAITVGPTLDYALSASAEAGDQEADLSLVDLGLMVGLVGFI